MRIPTNSFDADDLALCRAHGDAVDESSKARALLRWSDAVAPLAAINLTVRAFEVGVHMPADLPLPPSYWGDMDEWLKMPCTQPAGKTPKPAAPAAQSNVSAWRRGTDIPVSERVGLWHNRSADGTVFEARHADDLAFRKVMYRRAAPGTKEGDRYDESRYATDDLSARLADACSAASGAALVGVKADTGLRHLVCVIGGRPTGYVHKARDTDEANKLAKSWKTTHGSDWRLCDPGGWIPHTPAADSTCPVPDGVAASVRWRNGTEHPDHTLFRWDDQDGDGRARSDIVAWRPVAGGAAS